MVKENVAYTHNGGAFSRKKNEITLFAGKSVEWRS
jgi:hypothetical protein